MLLRSGKTSEPQTICFSDSIKCRKRCQSTDPTDHCPSKRVRLTKTNLAKHTRHMMARSKKSRDESSREDIKLHARASRSVQSQSDSTLTSKSRRTTSSNNEIVSDLIDHGIDPFQFPNRQPADFDAVTTSINRRRVSKSPSIGEFDRYRGTFNGPRPENEALVENKWTSLLSAAHPDFASTFKNTWGRFQDMEIDGRSVTAAPDFAYCRQSFGIPKAAIKHLGTAIKPSSNTDWMMPHFVAEHKAPGISVQYATHQTALDGAIIVQGDQKVFDYIDEPFPTRSTRAITAAYNGTDVRLDAHYYDNTHTLPFTHAVIGFYPTCSTYDDFKRCRRAIRNAQDFGYEKTNEIHDKLVSTAAATNTSAVPTPPETEDDISASVDYATDWLFTKDFWYRIRDNGTVEYYDAAVHGALPTNESSAIEPVLSARKVPSTPLVTPVEVACIDPAPNSRPKRRRR